MTVLLLISQLGFLLFLFLLLLPCVGVPKLCWITVARVDILETHAAKGGLIRSDRWPWWGGAQAQDLHGPWRLFVGMGFRPGTCTARGDSDRSGSQALGSQQTCQGLSRWETPPWRACEPVWVWAPITAQGGQGGRQEGVPQWWPHALYTTVQWCLTSLVSWSSSANLPGGEGPPLPPTVVLSLGLLPKPLFSPPGETQLRLKCPGLWHGPCTQVPLHPALHRLAIAFPSTVPLPERSLLCLLIPLAVSGVPWVWEPLLSPAPYHEHWLPSVFTLHSSSTPLSFSCPTWLHRASSHPSRRGKPSISAHQVCHKNCSNCTLMMYLCSPLLFFLLNVESSIRILDTSSLRSLSLQIFFSQFVRCIFIFLKVCLKSRCFKFW